MRSRRGSPTSPVNTATPLGQCPQHRCPPSCPSQQASVGPGLPLLSGSSLGACWFGPAGGDHPEHQLGSVCWGSKQRGSSPPHHPPDGASHSASGTGGAGGSRPSHRPAVAHSWTEAPRKPDSLLRSPWHAGRWRLPGPICATSSADPRECRLLPPAVATEPGSPGSYKADLGGGGLGGSVP